VSKESCYCEEVSSSEPPTPFVYLTEAEAVESVGKLVAQLRELERDLKEAVVAARAISVPWADIGAAMGVTRQAASERFGGDVRGRLVNAWHAIEVQLRPIEVGRGLEGRPHKCLQQLRDEGLVDQALYEKAADLWSARCRAVHDPGSRIDGTTVDELSDVVVPLCGTLWTIASGLPT